jgi:hypothetical protein
VVCLHDCLGLDVDGSDSIWADEDAVHWILKKPRKLNRPIPCKGRLGLWKPPARAVAALRKLL